jgi:hypothetical protein
MLSLPSLEDVDNIFYTDAAEKSLLSQNVPRLSFL